MIIGAQMSLKVNVHIVIIWPVVLWRWKFCVVLLLVVCAALHTLWTGFELFEIHHPSIGLSVIMISKRTNQKCFKKEKNRFFKRLFVPPIRVRPFLILASYLCHYGCCCRWWAGAYLTSLHLRYHVIEVPYRSMFYHSMNIRPTVHRRGLPSITGHGSWSPINQW